MDDVGEIPKFIQIALLKLGYNTPGSLRSIRTDEQISELIKEVQFKIRSFSESGTNETTKKEISEDLENYDLEINNSFTLLPGHVSLIRTVIEISQRTQQSSSIQEVTENVPRKRIEAVKDINSTINRLLQLTQQFLNSVEIKLQQKREISVEYSENKYRVQCPFCDSKIKVYMKIGINIQNFKHHIKTHQEGDSQDIINISTDETVAESNTSKSSSPLHSPPKKYIAVEKSAKDIKKETVEKQVCLISS